MKKRSTPFPYATLSIWTWKNKKFYKVAVLLIVIHGFWMAVKLSLELMDFNFRRFMYEVKDNALNTCFLDLNLEWFEEINA